MADDSKRTGTGEDQRLKEVVLAYVAMRSDTVCDESHQDLVRSFGPAFGSMMGRLAEEGLITSSGPEAQLTYKGQGCLDRIVSAAEDRENASVFEPGHPAYVLRLTFLFDEIDVFRTIKVPFDATFDDLHAMIQATLGWTESLSYEYVYSDDDPNMHYLLVPSEESIKYLIQSGRYELDPMPEGQDWRNAADVCLFAIMPTMYRMVYVYDFDIDWQIGVEFLGTDTLEDGRVVCVDGGGALFPEKLQGEKGYYDFLDLRNGHMPSHDTNAYLLYRRERYVPFDLAQTNDRLSDWASYAPPYSATNENIRLRVDNGRYFKLFVEDLLSSKVSNKTVDQHETNIEEFLDGYLSKVRGLTMQEGSDVVIDYLQDYLLFGDRDLPSISAFKKKIVSVKRFYDVMRLYGLITYASYFVMVELIKQRQDGWLDFIRMNTRQPTN